jgi:hypothetical protein
VEGVKASWVAQNHPEERRFDWIIRRLLLYLGLALLTLTIFALFFALTVWLGITERVNSWFKGGWVGFFMYSALLFWITVREPRQRWSHWSFWLAIGVFANHPLPRVRRDSEDLPYMAGDLVLADHGGRGWNIRWLSGVAFSCKG